MKPRNRSDDGQLVYLDPFLIDRLRLNSGLQPHTARVIATKLGCEVTDLLRSCSEYRQPHTDAPWYVP